MAKRGYFHRSSIFPNSISIWSQSKHTTGHLVKTLPSPWGRHGLWLWAPWPGALKAGGGGWGDRSGCFSFLLSGITAQGLNLLLHIFCLIFSRLAGKVNPLPAILPWLGALSASWLICNRTMLSVVFWNITSFMLSTLAMPYSNKGSINFKATIKLDIKTG